LRPFTRTSFHHQPEAQHPKSSAIHKLPADYPIFQCTAEITGLAAGTARSRIAETKCRDIGDLVAIGWKCRHNSNIAEGQR
jgi:hypothetical protein